LKRADDNASFRERIEFSSAEPFDFEALKSIASPPPTQIVPRTIDTAIRGKTIPEVEEKPAKPLPQSTSMLPRSASRNGNLSGPDPMDIEGLSVDLEPLKTRFSFSSQYLAEPQFSSAAPSKVPSRSNSFASDPAGAKKSETDILAAGIELDEDPLPQVGKKKRPAPSKKRKRVDEEGNERADDLPMDLAAEKEKPNEAEEKEPYEGPDYALMSTEELKVRFLRELRCFRHLLSSFFLGGVQQIWHPLGLAQIYDCRACADLDSHQCANFQDFDW